MGDIRLTAGMLEVIGWLRGRPIGAKMAAHLLGMFGEDGEVARVAAYQKALWEACACSSNGRCYNSDCGACASYRDGPLLDEVLSEIQAYERGTFIFDEKGDPIEVDPKDIPF